MALPRQRDSDQRNNVITENEQNCEHKPTRLAALLRRKPQRNSDHRPDQTCCRQRESPVIFNPVPAREYWINSCVAAARGPFVHHVYGDGFVGLIFSGG